MMDLWHPEIDTIFVDLFEVLARGVANMPSRIESMVHEKVPSCRDYLGRTITSRFFNAYNDNDSGLHAFFTGKVSEADFLENFLDISGYPVSSLSVADLKQALRGNLREYKHSGRILKKLAKNYKVVIMSDIGKEWAEYAEKNFPSLKIARQKAYSFDSGHTKRDLQAFASALENADSDPRKTLMIDDMKGNLATAQKFGMQVYAYRGHEDLLWALRDFGINGF